jgi:hypothetical protein
MFKNIHPAQQKPQAVLVACPPPTGNRLREFVRRHKRPAVAASLVHCSAGPQLQKLDDGARIVLHNFPIAGFKPDKTIEFISAEDDTNHVPYLWTAPLK